MTTGCGATIQSGCRGGRATDHRQTRTLKTQLPLLKELPQLWTLLKVRLPHLLIVCMLTLSVSLYNLSQSCTRSNC